MNDINLQVGFDIAKFQGELAKTNSILTSWGTQVKSTIGSAFGFFAVTNFVQKTVGAMAEFEHSMSALKAVTMATGAELEKLRNNALNLAGAFDANTIAKFETELARMGFTSEEVIQSTDAIINLATATGEDLVKSGEIAGSTLRSFNLNAEEMGRVANVTAAALNLSSLKLDSFGEAMKYVAPVAHQAGISLEEVSSLLVVLANNGIKGSMAGTSLRRIITDLARDGKSLEERLAELAKSGLTVSESFDEVGRTAQSTLITLANNTDKISLANKQIGEMNGLLERQAVINQEDLTGSWNKLSAAWDSSIQRGTLVSAVLRETLDLYTDFLNQVTGNQSALAISHLKRDIESFRLLTNPNYTEDEKRSIFKMLEDQAKAAGVSLKAYMENYELLKATLFGGNYNAPNAPSYIPVPFADPNATPKQTGISFAQGHAQNLANSAPGSSFGTNPFGDSLNLFGALGQIGENNGGPLSLMTNPLESMQKALTGIVAPMTKAKGLFDGFHLTSQRLGMGLINMGKQFSNGLAMAIQGTMPFAQAMAQMALSIVDSLETMALGYVLEHAAEWGINPIAAVAIGAVAFAGMKALFGSISSGSSGGGSAPSMSQVRSIDSRSNSMQGEFTVRGQDLVLVLNKQGYATQRVGG